MTSLNLCQIVVRFLEEQKTKEQILHYLTEYLNLTHRSDEALINEYEYYDTNITVEDDYGITVAQ